MVCLLPARTDTKWWHEYCMKGEVRLIKGRLKFGDETTAAPFPSAVVIFEPNRKRKVIAWEIYHHKSNMISQGNASED